MQLEEKKLVHDALKASESIRAFTTEKSFSDYRSDDMLRAAVERKFEIVGEALNQLKKVSPTLIENVADYHRIIAFRNVLIHGYAQVDDNLVWTVVQEKLPELLKDLAGMIAS